MISTRQCSVKKRPSIENKKNSKEYFFLKIPAARNLITECISFFRLFFCEGELQNNLVRTKNYQEAEIYC